ncbi:MAG: hypothetical protein DMD96_09350 [Candidatus Rokuibacteriota bacterium]|nr:MAG: hypothetical protein DMD96_09350 [Candidatus Rokubacteria bacterium]
MAARTLTLPGPACGASRSRVPRSVPEPGALLFVGGGLAGLAAIAWRRSGRK